MMGGDRRQAIAASFNGGHIPGCDCFNHMQTPGHHEKDEIKED
ncbi:hypothetical protein ACWGS9_03795 [Bradyrhizobium sp. Arg314]